MNNERVRAYKPRPNARTKNTADTLEGVDDLPHYSIEQLPIGQILTGDCLHMLRRLPSRCADLVILDPPYFKVVGEVWDHKWRTEQDYCAWFSEWFSEIERICKRSASVYLFGYMRNLFHVFHGVTALGFEFRQEITVDKGMKSVAGRKTSAYKQFPNTTETILFFVYDAKPEIRQLLTLRQKELGLSTKEINRRLGVKSNGGGMWSLYAGDNIMAQVPTPEMWERLETALDFKAPEDLKGFRFNKQMGLTNVWTDIEFNVSYRIHRTQKPLPLIKRLIQASTAPGDLVLDPFMGSGTTAVAATETRRAWIGVELDSEMAERARQRVAYAEPED